MHSRALDPQGDMLGQLTALHAHDAPVILSDEDLEVLQEKVDSVNQRDRTQCVCACVCVSASASAVHTNFPALIVKR